ncbi:MAG: T9SS type A sorting domain-containing protein [Chitinophagales bacterium]
MFLIFRASGQGSWQRIDIGYQYPIISAEAFGDTLLMLGGDGSIFHSNDLFDTYQSDTFFKGFNPGAMASATRNYGYITNPYVQGGLLKSVDGGAHWYPTPNGAPPGAVWGNVLKFSMPERGYAGAYMGSGTFYHTEDSGQTWTSAFINASCKLILQFQTLNDSTVYVLGNSSTDGMPSLAWTNISVSKDRGISWQFVSNVATRGYANFSFINDSTIILTGNKVIFRSSNQGLTFDTVFRGLSSSENMYSYISSISFISQDTGYVAFSRSVYRTTNAGITWTKTAFNFELADSFATINLIKALGSDEVIIASSNGIIYKTENGGGVWSGLNTIEVPETFSLSPNPAGNTLTIQTSTNAPLMLSIYAIDGRLIKQLNNLQQPNTEIDISELQSGIYFIAVSANGQQAVKRFVKQ